MGKPKECGNCNKPATVHLTQIVNNQIKKLDFCETCPYQKGITDPQGISLAELLAQGPSPFVEASSGGGVATAMATLQCGTCGLTPQDFKKHHRLGCPDCYSELSAFVMPMLANMQKDQIHHGKAPRRMLARIEKQRERSQLETDLANAVAEERYEEAAKLRDALKALRERAEPSDSDSGSDL
ncbi:MAG: UvrB/UvrC motif-containing protein [Opitutales bacterium]